MNAAQWKKQGCDGRKQQSRYLSSFKSLHSSPLSFLLFHPVLPSICFLTLSIIQFAFPLSCFWDSFHPSSPPLCLRHPSSITKQPFSLPPLSSLTHSPSLSSILSLFQKQKCKFTGKKRTSLNDREDERKKEPDLIPSLPPSSLPFSLSDMREWHKQREGMTERQRDADRKWRRMMNKKKEKMAAHPIAVASITRSPTLPLFLSVWQRAVSWASKRPIRG